MICPFCDCMDTKVKDTVRSGYSVIRRRKCTKCQTIFYTEEKAPTLDLPLKASMSAIKSEYTKKLDPTNNKKVVFVYGGRSVKSKMLNCKSLRDWIDGQGITVNMTKTKDHLNTRHLIIRFFDAICKVNLDECDAHFGFDGYIGSTEYSEHEQAIKDFILKEEKRNCTAERK